MRKPPFNHLWVGGIKNTPIGPIWTAVSSNRLAAVEIGGDEVTFIQKLASQYGVSIIRNDNDTLAVQQQIEAYLSGERQGFEIPLEWSGMSNFQQKALRAVYDIPYGETRSYGQIAAYIGVPHGSRAVGRANATNPIPLVIPCHRVIGADGGLRGYGSGEGIKTKAWLLSLEKGEKP